MTASDRRAIRLAITSDAGMMAADRQEIFDRWLTKHRGIAFKVLRAWADTPQDQDDLFQEICVRIWKSIPAYRGDAGESTWIYRVALFAAIDWHQREKKHRNPRSLEGVEHVLAATEEPADPRLEWLYAQIRRLDEIDRSLTLLLLDGFTYREMAEILGISPGNVGVKIHRIKRHLARQLEREQSDEP